jgi:hypothetical protein
MRYYPDGRSIKNPLEKYATEKAIGHRAAVLGWVFLTLSSVH